jgi:hypothetical protein
MDQGQRKNLMMHTPEYTNAMLADRERQIRDLRKVHEARRARSEAKRANPRRRRILRLRDPLRV